MNNASYEFPFRVGAQIPLTFPAQARIMGIMDIEDLKTGAEAKPVIQKVSYSHDAMIDMLIAEPGISQRELAARFGYTAPWVCQIIASDAFQARLAARKEELVDPVLRTTIEERMKALVVRSLDLLMEKLDKPNVPDAVALRAFELGSKGLGLGVKAPVVVQQPSGDRLEMLSDNLVKLFRAKQGVVYEAKNVTPEATYEVRPTAPDSEGAD